MSVLLCLVAISSIVGIAVAKENMILVGSPGDSVQFSSIHHNIFEMELSLGCYCKVVASDDSNYVIHDFGAITDMTEHTSLFGFSCRHMRKCPDECDRKVDEWLCTNEDECPTLTEGNSFVSFYDAGTCGSKAGSSVRTCGCTGGRQDDSPYRKTLLSNRCMFGMWC